MLISEPFNNSNSNLETIISELRATLDYGEPEQIKIPKTKSARLKAETKQLEINVQFAIERDEWINKTCDLFRKWLLRGDGVAMYRNENLGSPMVGHRKYCSFGSVDAQITLKENESAPPRTMPDIGAINWAYQLEKTFKL